VPKLKFNKLFQTKKSFQFCLLLIVVLLILRGISIYFKFPNILYKTDLFNSNSFALSDINPSLGDFLVNTFCHLIIIILIYYELKKVDLKKYNVLIINILLIFMSLSSLLFFQRAILSIYIGSQNLLDFKLNFSSFDYTFKIATILVLILNSTIYLFIQNLSILSFRRILQSKIFLL
jgi:hypothetical protein